MVGWSKEQRQAIDWFCKESGVTESERSAYPEVVVTSGSKGTRVIDIRDLMWEYRLYLRSKERGKE